MTSLRRWTADEVEKLKTMAQKCPAAKIAAELGRGRSAAAVKAHELKLSLRMHREGNVVGGETCSKPGPAGMDLG